MPGGFDKFNLSGKAGNAEIIKGLRSLVGRKKSMKKEGKYISIKTLVMSTVLIMAVGTALFLTVEADSPDWDVNDDGYCNLLDVNQVAYYVGSNNPDYDVNNDGIVDILDVTLILSNYGKNTSYPYPCYDVNTDGIVNIVDLDCVASHFNEIST